MPDDAGLQRKEGAMGNRVYISGLDMFSVHDGAGDMIDIRLEFTVSDGKKKALYSFDKYSTKDDQRTADETLRKSLTKKKLKQRIKRIGTWSSTDTKKDIDPAYNKIIPGGKKSGKASFSVIGANGQGTFVLKASLIGAKDVVSLSFLVPFDGAKPALNAFSGILKLESDNTDEIESYEETLSKIQEEGN